MTYHLWHKLTGWYQWNLVEPSWPSRHSTMVPDGKVRNLKMSDHLLRSPSSITQLQYQFGRHSDTVEPWWTTFFDQWSYSTILGCHMEHVQNYCGLPNLVKVIIGGLPFDVLRKNKVTPYGDPLVANGSNIMMVLDLPLAEYGKLLGRFYCAWNTSCVYGQYCLWPKMKIVPCVFFHIAPMEDQNMDSSGHQWNKIWYFGFFPIPTLTISNCQHVCQIPTWNLF